MVSQSQIAQSVVKIRPNCSCRAGCVGSNITSAASWLFHQGLPPWKKRQASLGAPTEWLSGSGGTGGTRMNDCAYAGKPRSAKKRRSRCPLQPV